MKSHLCFLFVVWFCMCNTRHSRILAIQLALVIEVLHLQLNENHLYAFNTEKIYETLREHVKAIKIPAEPNATLKNFTQFV